ncbi:MAG TPA: DUF3108 domain-containing protein [Bryobacteraceae bacterium]|nr:DUF3108 domain-containing protein [Bryobacteraceae bacterium]
MRFSSGAALVVAACSFVAGQNSPKSEADPPSLRRALSDKLTYDVEWRLIHAGTVVIDAHQNRANLELDSAGLVTSLFKIHDVYSTDYDESFCAWDWSMDSEEGKRHHETKATYDRSALRATYLERDLVKNTTLHNSSVAIPSCTHEVIGALVLMRGRNLAPGQTTVIPMSDGLRSANVKIEAQEREEVKTPAGTYKTIRYEADMMNGVIYRRKGRAFIWLTDDDKKLPVQIRVRMQFPIGTVTLALEKEEHP